MKKLRPYQSEAIDVVFDKLNKGVSKQILSLATGLGKTLTASTIAKRFNKILFLAHTEELIEQASMSLLTEFYPDVNFKEKTNQYGSLIDYFRANDGLFNDKHFGIVKADMFNIDTKITVASYQTIHRRLDKIPADLFDLIIIDECHLCMGKQIQKAISYFKPKLLLGLSATPIRSDGANLADVFDEIVYQYDIGNGINDGYLVELDGVVVKTAIELDSVSTLAGEFNQKELKQTVDTPERNKLIVDSYKKYADGKQNLIFCVDVEHAQNVCMAFKDAGYKAEFIVGDEKLTPDRKGTLDRFYNKETNILSNCAVLTAGYDNPYIECITLASPTKSLTRFIQAIGRGTRTLPGTIDRLNTTEERKNTILSSDKPKCIILDIVDTTSRHKVVNTWTLDSGKRIEDRVFMTKEKKEALIEVREKRKLEATLKEDKRIKLIPLPEIKLSNSIKMKEPATQKQLEYLKALGYDVNNNTYTKGNANELISNDPAPIKWIYVIKKAGYDTTKGVTRAQALKIFDEMREKERQQKEQEQTKNDRLINGLN